MFNNVFAQLTPEALLVSAAQGLVLTGLWRAVMWAAGWKPLRERWYWFTVFPLLAATLSVAALYLKPTPVIHAGMNMLAIGTMGSEKGASPATVTIVMTVRNEGMPTALDSWNLQAFSNEGNKYVSNSAVIPEAGVTLAAGQYPSRVFHRNDDLRLKVAPEPLRTGTITSGVMTFMFPGVRQDRLAMNDITFVLTFNDVRGKHYEIRQKSGDLMDAKMDFSFPGMSEEFENPKSTQQGR
jgi:hypothetical protein